ncbi:mitochondrial coenzyme A diphosphatase NUDT8-like isoform X2 [Oculina patagonica]
MSFTATKAVRRIFHHSQKFKLVSPRTFHSKLTSHLGPAEHFSRCYVTVASSCCAQCSKRPGLTRYSSTRTIRTSSLTRTCSNLNDAFTEDNKERLVKQLGRMKTRRSLLASCTEEAGVFVPFCNVNSVPSVLFTLRSNQLNKHRGEVSFPGGKRDPEDKSVVDTAVREMEEELGLEKRHVQVWAQMPAMPDRLGKIAITPVIGFIGEIDVNSLELNPEEVASVFTLSLDHLCSAKNQRYTKHKHLRVSIMKRPVFINGPYRIWGLTAIVLDSVMAVLCPEFYQRVLEIKGHGLG